MLRAAEFGKLRGMRRLLDFSLLLLATGVVLADRPSTRSGDLRTASSSAVAAEPMIDDASLYAPMPSFSEPIREIAQRPFPSSAASRSAWIEQADFLRPRLAAKGLRIGDAVHLRLFKESRELELWMRGDDGYVLYRVYPICEMSGGLGPKRFEGDFQAPEGYYTVPAERLHPHSEFHLAFNLGYPNAYDRARGRTGSNIMIHGGCASNGCFAMTDYYMEQIYILVEAALRGGQAGIGVEIYPFRMTDENLAAHSGSHWSEFWQSLRPMHDHFVEHRRPARILAGRDGYETAPDWPGSALRDAALSAP